MDWSYFMSGFISNIADSPSLLMSGSKVAVRSSGSFSRP